MRSLTIKRENADIFTIASNFPYWSDGSNLSVRLAFCEDGNLSSIRAQAIDAIHGIKYILVSPFSVKNLAILSIARGLNVGDSQSIVSEPNNH